jgi:protein-tyrosine phosphatase
VSSWTFAAIAAALTALALWSGAWGLLYLAAISAAVTVVYAARSPRLFGKRPDGTLAWYAWLLWAPLFAYQWLVHVGVRHLTREPVADEVAPGIWVGRRPRVHELPAGTAIVVDLCAEFPVSAGVKDGRAYVACPTLDATSPTPAELVDLVDRVLAAGGPAFIHCAFGHGRSATVAAAVLVRRGDATLADVEGKLQARRPRIGLNATQRAALAAASAAAPRG